MNSSILGALKDQIDDSAQGHTFIRACQIIPSRATLLILTEIISAKVARLDTVFNCCEILPLVSWAISVT